MKITQAYLWILIIFIPSLLRCQIGIGTSTPKAALDVVSTSQGILPPRMTGAQILALTVGADHNSMFVYATSPSGAITKTGYWYYDHTATSWKPFDGDITATNGVNISSGNIRLGGALTQATTISGLTATNKISFTGTGTDAFNIDGTTFSIDATNDRIGVGMTNPQYKLDVTDDIRVSSNRINFTSARLLLEGGQVDGGLQGSGMYILDGQANGLRRQWYIGKPYNLTGLGIGSLQSDIFAASAANSTNTHLYVDGVNNRVGIGTTTPNSRLDLGASFGSTTTDVVGKKLAVYNNAAGTDFYGLGISSALLQFHAASTASEDAGMVLNSGGSVGIGTVTPSERLHIFGGNVLLGGMGTNSVANPMLRIWSNANVNGSGGFIEFNEADNNYGYTFRHNTNTGAYGDDGIAFEVKTGGTYSPKMMFGNSGNLGIGTMSPTEKLDVASGNVKATGWVRGFATGQLLNTVFIDDPTMTTTVISSNVFQTVVSYTYTPVYNNSKIMVEYTHQNYTISGSAGGGTDDFESQLAIGATTPTTNYQVCNIGVNGPEFRSSSLFPIKGVSNNSSTSAVIITIKVRRVNSDDNLTFSGNNGTLIIQEIAN